MNFPLLMLQKVKCNGNYTLINSVTSQFNLLTLNNTRMKKSVLFIFLLAISISGFSQTTIFGEYFDGGVIPATWSTIDKDGDGNNWFADTWDNPLGFTESYVVSESWLDPDPLTPENYLVSPQINLSGLTGTVQLKYTLQVGDADYFAEHYKVAVSTTGKEVADFTNIVKDEICVAEDYYDVSPFWHERTVDLTPFIGQNIYLTFCHYDCTDMYRFYLDSVQIVNTPTVNIADRDQSNVSIYPNPATDKIKVTGAYESAQVQLFTADGRLVYKSAKETKQSNINVSRLENGVYILKINSQKGVITKKINVSH